MFAISYHIQVEDHNKALFSTLPFIPTHQLNLLLNTFPWIAETCLPSRQVLQSSLNKQQNSVF